MRREQAPNPPGQTPSVGRSAGPTGHLDCWQSPASPPSQGREQPSPARGARQGLATSPRRTGALLRATHGMSGRVAGSGRGMRCTNEAPHKVGRHLAEKNTRRHPDVTDHDCCFARSAGGHASGPCPSSSDPIAVTAAAAQNMAALPESASSRRNSARPGQRPE